MYFDFDFGCTLDVKIESEFEVSFEFDCFSHKRSVFAKQFQEKVFVPPRARRIFAPESSGFILAFCVKTNQFGF
jgi:hypothetical protein